MKTLTTEHHDTKHGMLSMMSMAVNVSDVLTAHQRHQELWNRSPFQP